MGRLAACCRHRNDYSRADWATARFGRARRPERFAAFAVIGVCLSLGYPKRRLAILLVVAGIIGVLELAQHLVPSRHGRPPNGTIKMAGALLGLAAATIGSRSRVVP
jgi:hypothetical protein